MEQVTHSKMHEARVAVKQSVNGCTAANLQIAPAHEYRRVTSSASVTLMKPMMFYVDIDVKFCTFKSLVYFEGEILG